jgi:hypothetical protein
MIKGFHFLEHWQQNGNYWVVCGEVGTLGTLVTFTKSPLEIL